MPRFVDCRGRRVPSLCRDASGSNPTLNIDSKIAHQGAAVGLWAAVLRCLSAANCSSELLFGGSLIKGSELGLSVSMLQLPLTRRRPPRLSAPGHLPAPADSAARQTSSAPAA